MENVNQLLALPIATTDQTEEEAVGEEGKGGEDEENKPDWFTFMQRRSTFISTELYLLLCTFVHLSLVTTAVAASLILR